MATTIGVFAVGIAGPSGFTAGSATASNAGTGLFGLIVLVLFVAQRLSVRSFPTVGNVNISTGLLSTALS